MATMTRPIRNERRGFTLVELLIAMAITLLLMAGLAKAFAMIGKTMKEGRSKVSLSGKLRGLSFRVRSDLRSRTVQARPPIRSEDEQGYFLYYEGPLTEHSAALFGHEAFRYTRGGDEVGSSSPAFATTVDGPTYYRHSRFGDIDDYIAFTAEAPADGWFTGKVPAYLVDDDPNIADPMEPRIIRSKYAEIIIWASPTWQVDPTTNDLAYAPAPSGMPLYVDDNNDLIPDSVTLHQRVLLIRPDLNDSGTISNTSAGASFDSDFLRTVGGGGPGNVPPQLRHVYPISNPALLPANRYYPSYVDPASLGAQPQRMFVSNWLVGMTPVHHFFDISLRRIVHPVTGEPTEYVAANSLEDLTKPHNRFGHVRYPGRYFGQASGGRDHLTSMPLLALAWNDSLLRRPGPAPPWFPAGYPSPLTLAGAQQTSLFNGWLLPHFALGDPNPPPTPPATPDSKNWQRHYLLARDARWDRTGEDIIAANVHAFDIKGYDSGAPVFLTTGFDGEPGRAGVDDDGSGNDDISEFSLPFPSPQRQILSELGAIGSDDVVVRVGDIAINSLMQSRITDPRDVLLYDNAQLTLRQDQMLASTGDFVDLFYPLLAGGPMLDLYRAAPGPYPTSPPRTPPTPPLPQNLLNAVSNFNNFLVTDLSGWPLSTSTLTSMKHSGKMFHTDNMGVFSGNFAYMQPCFDTWTDHYESDGFDQTASRIGELTGTNGTVWVLYDQLTGFPGRNARVKPALATSEPYAIDTSQHDATELETSPPFESDLPAVSITVRLGDPVTGEISQSTVIEDLLN